MPVHRLAVQVKEALAIHVDALRFPDFPVRVVVRIDRAGRQIEQDHHLARHVRLAVLHPGEGGFVRPIRKDALADALLLLALLLLALNRAEHGDFPVKEIMLQNIARAVARQSFGLAHRKGHFVRLAELIDHLHEIAVRGVVELAEVFLLVDEHLRQRLHRVRLAHHVLDDFRKAVSFRRFPLVHGVQLGQNIVPELQHVRVAHAVVERIRRDDLLRVAPVQRLAAGCGQKRVGLPGVQAERKRDLQRGFFRDAHRARLHPVGNILAHAVRAGDAHLIERGFQRLFHRVHVVAARKQLDFVAERAQREPAVQHIHRFGLGQPAQRLFIVRLRDFRQIRHAESLR